MSAPDMMHPTAVCAVFCLSSEEMDALRGLGWGGAVPLATLRGLRDRGLVLPSHSEAIIAGTWLNEKGQHLAWRLDDEIQWGATFALRANIVLTPEQFFAARAEMECGACEHCDECDALLVPEARDNGAYTFGRV